MRRLLWIILFGSTIAATLTSASPQQKTGDQAVRIARRTFEKSVEVKMAARRSQCMSAIGSPAFCDCLNAFLPLAADFQRYISTTTTSDPNEQLSPDDKKMADLIIATRDECVAKVFNNAQKR